MFFSILSISLCFHFPFFVFFHLFAFAIVKISETQRCMDRIATNWPPTGSKRQPFPIDFNPVPMHVFPFDSIWSFSDSLKALLTPGGAEQQTVSTGNPIARCSKVKLLTCWRTTTTTATAVKFDNNSL
uniref:Putative secreted protein n=1 Tax=Anopheles darlingi TaxID=43151 RepID=A0A2M4D1C2_ANODA